MIDSKVHKALSTVARYHDNNFATQAELVNHAIECVINQLAVDDPLARAALDAELDHLRSIPVMEVYASSAAMSLNVELVVIPMGMRLEAYLYISSA